MLEFLFSIIPFVSSTDEEKYLKAFENASISDSFPAKRLF